ncbi:sigma 54-interacting transcriptional regulator [Anaerovorax odorimutans]|uniref:Sigma 54-interacting transcriptional regulator n=1 Tax=Anaerovorax odorimutans TaxID=109327 RepID=A0ABT1RMP1_9FIRM|nr:sigma 54-interacting transcriptional regulator [Anaerovorax odorimutans]MCQ4636459.1 sigma 54-interacting transcriptional regulator [Anaerovorax odorimutans]
MDFNKLTDGTKRCISAVIECIDDGIFITDGEGTVVALNKSALGCQSRENLIGKNMRQLIEEGIYEDSLALRVIKEKKPLSMVQHEETDILTTAIPHIESGQVKMVVCCEREVYELDALRRELKESKAKNLQYEQELRYLRKNATRDVGIIAESAQMHDVIELALTAARFDSRVLLQGETGTGKEVIAKLIYRNGKRADKPFVDVNCGAIPENLLESELFGYERGAFTGAREDGKKGVFELADGGVLFLDEIGETSINFQTKLLRCIQEGAVTRVGGDRAIPVDVQIIAATNRDLMKEIKEGRFREDLYYRLNVFPIQIPPLRERKSDIASLVYLYAARFNDKYGTDKMFSRQALEALQNYKWPGNVRELANVIERLILISKDKIIKEEELQPLLFADSAFEDFEITEASLEENVARIEQEVLSRSLKKYKKRSELADALDISVATLNRKLRKYGLGE